MERLTLEKNIAEICSSPTREDESLGDAHLVYDNMLDGFAYCRMLYDKAGKPVDFIYLQVNDAFEKLTGLTRQAVLGKKVTEAIPGIKDQNPEIIETYGRVVASGLGERFEVFLKPLHIWLYVSVFCPKKDHFVAIFENVTERKANEDLLKKTMERSKAIADSLPELVFEADLSGKLTYANDRAFELTGYTKEEFEGLSVFNFVAPKDRQRAQENFEAALTRDFPAGNEYLFVRKDGSVFPVIVKSTSIKEDGKAVGLRGLIIDVTDDKKVIDKIAFQAQLLESVGQAVVAIDKERIVRYWNHGATQLFSLTSQEAFGRTLDELLTEVYPAEDDWVIHQRLAQGEILSSETQVKRKDGSIVPVIISRSPVIVDNELVGSISIYTDIADQKTMEYKLAEYVDALANSSEKINDLNDKLRVVGTLSRHDIRNKLFAFNSLMYLLKKKVADNPAAQQYLQEMDKVSKQLLTILEFQRTYEQVGSEKHEMVDVEKFFNEAVALVSNANGVSISFHCKGLKVEADSLLRQVIYNLIDNTLSHGEKATQIRLHCQQSGGSLQLIYEDNGVGISPQDKARLFEKGFGKGTGMGLYMIKHIIATYGWTIEEVGEVGAGAKFVMKLPQGGYRTNC